MLDPRFESPVNAESLVRRLKLECAAPLRDATVEEERPSTSRPQPEPAASSQSTKSIDFGLIAVTAFIHVWTKIYAPFSVTDLWKVLDREAAEARTSQNVTAAATVEVQRYLATPPLDRSQHPVVYWERHKTLDPNLYQLENQDWATPASSVPCERVFESCGNCFKKEKPPQALNCGETVVFE